MFTLQPKPVYSLEKSAYFHEKTSLRTLWELCGDSFGKAQERLHAIQSHFSRPNILLQLVKDDQTTLGKKYFFLLNETAPVSSRLTIGKTVMLNFNMHAER